MPRTSRSGRRRGGYPRPQFSPQVQQLCVGMHKGSGADLVQGFAWNHAAPSRRARQRVWTEQPFTLDAKALGKELKAEARQAVEWQHQAADAKRKEHRDWRRKVGFFKRLISAELRKQDRECGSGVRVAVEKADAALTVASSRKQRVADWETHAITDRNRQHELRTFRSALEDGHPETVHALKRGDMDLAMWQARERQKELDRQARDEAARQAALEQKAEANKPKSKWGW
jgi:hypothetical protein